MSDKRKSSAYDYMTDQQKVEWLATEVMGWKLDELRFAASYAFTDGTRKLTSKTYYWNPLTDWNHWRQVEVVACNNHRLWHEFMHNLGINTTGTTVPSDCSKMYVRTPLELRARALYLAYQSLR